MRALHTAATGMAAQELNVQVISNNIANLRTTGYKKQRAAFQDLIYDHVRRVGAQASDQGTILPVGIDIGGGVKTVGTPRLMTQGTLSPTGNDLDIAIRGEGFFKIQMPDGTYAYTRDGSFQMDQQGRIVTAQGNPVQPTITIPQNSSGLTINAQGQVSVTLPGSTTPTTVGQIGLTRFINKAGPAADRRQSVHRHAGLRHAAGRRRQCRRVRRHAAGQPRTGQCRSGLGNLRPDRGAARLRDERQGDQRRRPDAAIHRQHVPLRRADDDHPFAPPRRRPARGRRGAVAGAEPRRCRRAPVLRASVNVASDVVRIGDVVDNAGTAAQIAIYRAPDLGTTGSLPIAQVLDALRAHQVIGVDTGDLKRDFGDAAGAHARQQGHRTAGRPRAGAPQRAWRRRQSVADLRPRRADAAARCLQQRRAAAGRGALRSAQRPLRRHASRSPTTPAPRRPGCASPAPRSRPSKPRCWRAASSATRS